MFLILDRREAPVATVQNLRSTDVLEELSEVSRALSRETGESVVRVEVRRGNHLVDEELRRMFGNQSLTPTGQGSGVVVSADGLVLTNYHVVAAAKSISVSKGDESCNGELIGFDVLTDLALIRPSQALGPPVHWGDSSQLEVGDFIWAIGNPFGLRRSVTFGIVSAIEQDPFSGNHLQNYFQTDAAVNPGNSGGPVVSRTGAVVGINTAIAGDAYRGIGFAIPSSTVRDVLKQLMENGRVRRGWLGVNLANLSKPKAVELGLDSASGALVDSYAASSEVLPAKAADLRVDDVIVEWNDTPIDSAVQLGRLIAQTIPGTVASVKLFRGTRLLGIDITIGERP